MCGSCIERDMSSASRKSTEAASRTRTLYLPGSRHYAAASSMARMFDYYGLRACALPVYLTIAPVAVALVAIVPQAISLPLGGAAAIVLMPVAFLAGQLGADFGKRLEKRLWRLWDGAPSTRFLRHSNLEFNHVTRDRLHEKLRTLGLHVPTQPEQAANPRGADAHYESCAEEMIRRTRKHDAFPLVLKALTEYGFRRNLLGLRPVALPIAVVSALACLATTWKRFDTANPPAVAITATLLSVALLLTWMTWVNEATVRLAANRYARVLLEAVMEQE